MLPNWKQPKKHKKLHCTKIAARPTSAGTSSAISPVHTGQPLQYSLANGASACLWCLLWPRRAQWCHTTWPCLHGAHTVALLSEKGQLPYTCGAGDHLPKCARSAGPRMTCRAPTKYCSHNRACSCRHDRPARERGGIILKSLPNFHDRAPLLVQTLSEDRFCYFVLENFLEWNG